MNTGNESQFHNRAAKEIEPLSLLIALARHKRLLLGLPMSAAVAAIVVTLLMPNVFTATARILPPQSNASSAAGLLGQLAAISGAGGIIPAVKNPIEIYVGMLKSRTIADRLIERFNLMDLYRTETLVETRLALSDVTVITPGKDGIITIEVDDEDPKRAAEIANAYVIELEKLNETLALTEASQRRLFFEKQLKQAKETLASAEIELKKTQEKTGLIKLDDQGRAIIEAVAQLKAQVFAKEVQLGALKSFATERNPELIRAQEELQALRTQLRKMERDKVAGEGEVLLPTGRVPEAGLEYIRRLRDVKYHETLFELVAKQYELARLDEAKEASVIQVVDKAVMLDRKSKPKRALIILLTGVVAGLLAILIALIREAYDGIASNPEQAKRLEILKQHLWRRSA
jgi:uncharacterized protein involved in exopolysaccharide biosynthesis